MKSCKKIINISDIAKRINRGSAADVDYLMQYLNNPLSPQYARLIDFALSQIRPISGKQRIKYYLLNGTKIQRNYASLYFKKHNIQNELTGTI